MPTIFGAQELGPKLAGAHPSARPLAMTEPNRRRAVRESAVDELKRRVLENAREVFAWRRASFRHGSKSLSGKKLSRWSQL